MQYTLRGTFDLRRKILHLRIELPLVVLPTLAEDRRQGLLYLEQLLSAERGLVLGELRLGGSRRGRPVLRFGSIRAPTTGWLASRAGLRGYLGRRRRRAVGRHVSALDNIRDSLEIVGASEDALCASVLIHSLLPGLFPIALELDDGGELQDHGVRGSDLIPKLVNGDCRMECTGELYVRFSGYEIVGSTFELILVLSRQEELGYLK